ncbi:helix-turn-helix domain-containing protein [Pseudomonas iridis]|uniref:Helix-turn-helix domain-containing protein n=1 Tax=Pseudomonas iridis TaxID=2710587 RepID=A0ABW8DKQ4_9PSED
MARVILLAAQASTREELVRRTGFSRPTVIDWYQRFQALRAAARAILTTD